MRDFPLASTTPPSASSGGLRLAVAASATQSTGSKLALESSWRDAMRQTLAAKQIDLDALLLKFGVPPEETDPRALSDAYSDVWDAVVEQTGNVAIGLNTPHHPLVAMGMLSHLVLSAPTLRAGLNCMLRFSPLLSPAVAMELEVRGNTSRLSVSILSARRAAPMQRYDFIASVLLQSFNWVTAHALRPLEVEHSFDAPADTSPWETAFACKVVFGAPRFCIVFNTADLDLPIPTANASVAEHCERLASQTLMQLGGIQERVRQMLIQELPKGDPRREVIAAMLCMSERTLQRRLLEENTTFNKLVDETRRALAQHYLSSADVSTTEMSFALGFADPSNFYRACKRWFGHSPRRLRESSQAA